jgi:hypothetical protein
MMENGMDTIKRKRLEKSGWKVGTASDFLGLDSAEEAYIDFKLELAKQLHKLRIEKNLTQVELAKLLESSQSRVAKMEAGDPGVSVDLLIRSLFALGASPRSLLHNIPR